MTLRTRLTVYFVLLLGLASPAVALEKVWTFSLPTLNLREYPDISTKVLARIPYGTALEVQLTANGGDQRWNECVRLRECR